MVVKWYTHGTSDPPKGVALVVHGLNLNPERMEEIITVLNKIKLDVAMLSLRGHGDNFEQRLPGESKDKARLNAIKKVTYQIWKEEILQGYEIVRQRSQELNCPVHFVGYSLGGLMGCDLVLNKSETIFEKMILFAPAIAIHKVRVPFLRLLYLFPGLVIPSLSPKRYRSNRGTPIAAYLSLLESLRNFKSKINQLLNIPTVIFIDRNDELVSYQKMKKMIKTYRLDQWSIYKIIRRPQELKYPFHHLIIDAVSAGHRDWSIIREKIISHLSPASQTAKQPLEFNLN